MGRSAKYGDEAILDAALELAGEHGPHGATVVAIAERVGAPSGSIYHRFASRDLILARLWIRTIRHFQEGFLAAMALRDPLEAAKAAVAHTVSWTVENPREAKVLVLYRREDLIALWPDELDDELATLNDEVRHSIVTFAQAQFGAVTAETVGRTRLALIDQPYAAARQIIVGSTPPAPWLIDAVTTAALAVLGETSSSPPTTCAESPKTPAPTAKRLLVSLPSQHQDVRTD